MDPKTEENKQENSIIVKLDPKKVLESRGKIVRDDGTFKGSNLIDWLVENYNPYKVSRKELEEMINKEFLDPELPHQFIYATKEDAFFEDSSKKKFRFLPDQYRHYQNDSYVINLQGYDLKTEMMYYDYENPEDEPGVKIAYELKDVIGDLYAEYLTEDGSGVDYEGIVKSPNFKDKFLPIVRKLAFVNLSQLVGKDDEIKAFFINIYNVLNIHANCARFAKTKSLEKNFLDRNSFFSTWKYCIAGYTFTLNDIEHGMLRKNNTHGQKKSLFQRLFSPSKTRWKLHSPKFKFIVGQVDPRIHFSLNCGAKSCPPIKVYEADSLEMQLNMATKNFVKNDVTHKEEGGKLVLEVSKIFDWFKGDFGGSNKALTEFFAKNVKDKALKKKLEEAVTNETEVKIKFKSYDWGANKTSKKK